MNYILTGIEPMPRANQLKNAIHRYLPNASSSFHPDPLAMASLGANLKTIRLDLNDRVIEPTIS